MTALDQVAQERVEKFIDALEEYQKENNMSVGELAYECEVDPTVIYRAYQRKGSKKRPRVISLITAFKISVATCVPL